MFRNSKSYRRVEVQLFEKHERKLSRTCVSGMIHRRLMQKTILSWRGQWPLSEFYPLFYKDHFYSSDATIQDTTRRPRNTCWVFPNHPARRIGFSISMKICGFKTIYTVNDNETFSWGWIVSKIQVYQTTWKLKMILSYVFIVHTCAFNSCWWQQRWNINFSMHLNKLCLYILELLVKVKYIPKLVKMKNLNLSIYERPDNISPVHIN